MKRLFSALCNRWEKAAQKFRRKREGARYVFVGPPGSGKTVYFACAIDQLQRRAIDQDNETEVTHLNAQTLKICRQTISEMHKGKWPPKTQDPQLLEFDLKSPRLRVRGKHALGVRSDKLLCHDYPGEAFAAAFGDRREAHEAKFVKAGEQLRSDLAIATGVFVLIDAEKFHDAADERFHVQLFDLFKFIEEEASAQRVAIIFSKMDLFKKRNDKGFLDRLKRDYPAAWNLQKRANAHFFFVASVRSHRVNKQGQIVPPDGYETSDSDGLLDPLVWMLNLKWLRSL